MSLKDSASDNFIPQPLADSLFAIVFGVVVFIYLFFTIKYIMSFNWELKKESVEVKRKKVKKYCK